MNILPIEEVPENLQLTKEEIINERCKLIEGQVKILTDEIDKLKLENDKYKSLIAELYTKLNEVYLLSDSESFEDDSNCATDGEDEEDEEEEEEEKE